MNWFTTGAIVGATGVLIGAFGAHGLRDRVSAELLAIFETGVRYQMYHGLALLAVAYAVTRWPGTLPTVAGWSFLAGIVVFSGSLYLMTFTGLRWLGAITPIGGVCLIVGWICLALAPLIRQS
ncbi:MAG: DUF423 domain-containing protein [Gammaproteobacteria bacterium]|nr:DUF423 domain-containing protein [Gammaproteobacteria bacterium]